MSLGPEFIDEYDAGVEIALLAGDPFINGVGDDVADAARVLGPGEELLAGELLAGEGVPEAKLGCQPAVAAADAADHQRLRVDYAPILEIWYLVHADAPLDEGGLVYGDEQARGAEVARHHLRDLTGDLGIDRSVAREVRNGDGQGLNVALGDVELEHGLRRLHRGKRTKEHQQ